MKKTMILSLALLLGMGSAVADDVSVADVTLPQNGTAVVSISLNNPDNTYTAGQMALILPDGVAAVTDGSGDPQVVKGERFATTNHSIGASHLDNGSEQFTIFSINSTAIARTEGILFSVNIQADESLAAGTVLQGRFINIELTTTEGARTLFNEQTFTITIGEPVDPWIILDETSATVPEATANVDVRVLRNIKANEWCTLCLPFDMTEEQVYEAFGDDVELAEYIDHEMNDEGTQITVNFDAANLAEDGLMANTPYIIKTSQDVAEFMVNGVSIEPDEEGAMAEYTNGRNGSRKEVYGTFRGTFHAQTIVPENCLFLSGNKFWYSRGLTKMKAFRAYFDFVDVLASVENTADVKMSFNVDGEATGIGLTPASSPVGEGSATWYDLQGRRIDNSQFIIHNSKLKRTSPGAQMKKGVYISDGRKVAVH